ncbi:alpha-D-ribose 1-methylphosphonate 5-triphosphate diphosphatase [Viridibacterium curvum]|uniref:Alpha-D-ribose 1-methylphosphonate 5-triphosphate diphosphatase n=1 Tax=Viridibacterium curvum TaxID=1101404 RepID=A0ABP9QBP8_9RHOO
MSTIENLALRGGQTLRPDHSWDDAPLHVAAGLISDAATAGPWLDTSDCLVLPGIVDFHGDAFERQIMPRPKVSFPLDVALLDTDRQLAANGITTALHGITHSWEGGLRGRDTAEGLFAAFDTLRPRLQVDHRVHLRFECHNVEGEDDAQRWLQSGRVSLLAFNEHIDAMRKRTHKLQEYADRAATDIAGFQARMEAAAARSNEVPGVIDRLAQKARALNIPMASHDDHSIAMRDAFQQRGCHISEFPLTREVAEHARANHSPVVCGAPNVLRGGSHIGAPSAATLAAEGLCSILASDYYYPAPLHAAFKLAAQGLLPFAQAWALVSHNPAQALALRDRGHIATGQRADLLVVDALDATLPRLVATLAAGRIVYLAEGARLHG